MIEEKMAIGYEFDKEAVEKVQGLLANPLSVYDPMFVGNNIKRLCETTPLFPDTDRLLIAKEALNTLTPMNNDYRAYEEEVNDYYIRRALIFRGCFKALGVTMPAVGDLRFIGKYKELTRNTSLFFPLEWIEQSNHTSNPLFSINTWKYLPVEYKPSLGKAYTNKSESDYGDIVEVLAHRFYNTNEYIRKETDRLGISSNVGFDGLTAEEFFVAAVKEVFYGSRGNKNRATLANTVGVNFVLYLIARSSTLAV